MTSLERESPGIWTTKARRHEDTKKNFVTWCLCGSLLSASLEPHSRSLHWVIAPSLFCLGVLCGKPLSTAREIGGNVRPPFQTISSQRFRCVASSRVEDPSVSGFDLRIAGLHDREQ